MEGCMHRVERELEGRVVPGGLTVRLALGVAAVLATIAAVLAAVAPPAHAQETPEFAYIGARARGMGAAHTAVAAGIDAVAWNPAGLAALDGPELKADMRLHFGSGTVVHGIDTFDSGAGGVVPVENFTDSPTTRFTYYLIGGAAPLPFRDPDMKRFGLTGAFGYRRVLDQLFGQEQLIEFDPGGGFTIPFEHVDESEGGLDAFTLSFAGKPHSRVSLGANLNFLTGFVEETDQQRVAFQGAEFFLLEQGTRFTFGGTMFELGAQVKVTDMISVGGMLRPSFTVDQEGGPGHLRLLAQEGGPTPPADTLINFRLDDRTVDVPLFYSLGAQATPLPGLVVASDWQYKPWNEVTTVVHAPARDMEPENSLYPAHSFHIGAEYTLRRATDLQVPLRLGFHTAPTALADVDSLSGDIGPTGFRNFRGERIEGNTWTGGVGLYFSTVHFDVSIDRTTYTYSEWLFDQVPFPGQPLAIVELEETFTNLYFSSTIHF
jgi:hypothetical protein